MTTNLDRAHCNHSDAILEKHSLFLAKELYFGSLEHLLVELDALFGLEIGESLEERLVIQNLHDSFWEGR